MAKSIADTISELQAKKEELDEQIAALEKAREIMTETPTARKSVAKKTKKAKKTARKGKTAKKTKAKSRKRKRAPRRNEEQKEADKKQILDVLSKGEQNGMSIGQICKQLGRSSDVTVRYDLRELLESGKIKRAGERAKTVYFK